MQTRRLFESGEWEIDQIARELRANGIAVPIGGRAFEIVEVLARANGEFVTKDDLVKRVWPGATVVEDATIRVHISAIRKALSADRTLLQTAPGRGYRLLGNWTIRQNSAPAMPVSPVRAAAAARSFTTNIPVAARALVGRETAVQSLRDLVSAYRAVTLTGPGGIGKTVLAAELARRLFPTIQSDVFFVELVSLSDPQLVPTTVAGTLGLRVGGDEISAVSVARAIGSRKVLLVLDNCEHVIDAAAGLAEALLRQCPNAAILSTSREVLRIEGEFVYHVAPLEVPAQHEETSAEVLELSAVQLFLARTGSPLADIISHGDNLPAIAAIVRRLDGIPLAIEFAAARASALGIREVAEHLDDRFALLTGGRRTALPRHQTLRATLDWSYELLPEAERCLLRRVAVFPAGFTLEAAIAVTGDSSDITSASAIMNGMSNLVEKSLVRLDQSVPTGRWRLLETIRAYALEKLETSGEAPLTAHAHAKFFCDFVVSNAPASPSDPTLSGLPLCLREIDNVRAALDWSFSAAGDIAIGVTLTAAYAPVWLQSALLVECRERTERALDNSDSAAVLDTRLRLQLNMAYGLAAIVTVRLPIDKTRIVLTEALDIAEQLNDGHARLWAIYGLWLLHFYTGQIRAALPFAERQSVVASSVGEPFGLVIADRLIGNTLQHSGDHSRAIDYFERVIARSVLPTARQQPFFFQTDQRAHARALLSRALLMRGLLDQAAEQARISLEEANATHNELSICLSLKYGYCPVALMTGNFKEAERSIARLSEITNSLNAQFWKSAARYLEGKLLIERGEFAAGTALLRAEHNASERTGWKDCYPEYLGVFAQGLAGLGRFPEALAAINQALDEAEHGGERYYLAELLRLKGEICLAKSGDESVADVEDCFHAALKVARDQGALLVELRVATSIARWRIHQRRSDDGREVLAPVYARFVEGFNTAHVSTARALLAHMND